MQTAFSESQGELYGTELDLLVLKGEWGSECRYHYRGYIWALHRDPLPKPQILNPES